MANRQLCPGALVQNVQSDKVVVHLARREERVVL